MTPSSRFPHTALLRVSLVIASLVFAGLVAWSWHIRSTSGSLQIRGFSDDAAISISRANSEAKVIGIGSAQVRLAPGTYQIASSAEGHIETAVAVVKVGKQTAITLTKSTKPDIASPDTIRFSNFEALLNVGISLDQVDHLKTLYFYYNKTAKVVTVDGTTTSGPHEPDSDQPFTLHFTSVIDGTPYDTTLTYRNFDDMRLTLSTPGTGTVVFDKTYLPPGHTILPSVPEE